MNPPASPRRIMVMGPPGSGKSTLARRLGEALRLPVTHLDQLHHGPGWRPRARDVFLAETEAAAQRPEWVIDGNYLGAIALRLWNADLIVLLDLPRHITLPRLVRRIVTGWGRVRPDSAPGCPERLDPAFLRYAWRWPHDVRPRVVERLDLADPRLVRLTRPAEVARFVAALTPPARASAS